MNNIQIILLILITASGFPIGKFIASKTKEELEAGRKWFLTIIYVSFFLIILSLFFLNGENLLFILSSLIFIILIALASLKKKAIKNKKGVSDIVAVVLIIAMTIAAGFIVYSFLIPYLKTETSVSQECYYAELEILEGDYTYHNSTTNELYVQVMRGDREVELSGIQIKLSGGPISKIIEVREGNPTSSLSEFGETTVSLPDVKETRTYVLDLNVLGITSNDFSIIEVAPVVRTGNKDNVCDIRDKFVLSG